MDLGLTGRVAVVTGASRGIGLAVTRALVAEGVHVVAGARESSEQLEELAAWYRDLVAVAVGAESAAIHRDKLAELRLDATRDRAPTIVVGIVGGQGSLFGRGNQQISAEVIRRAGPDSIVILAGLDKLQALDARLDAVADVVEALRGALAGDELLVAVVDVEADIRVHARRRFRRRCTRAASRPVAGGRGRRTGVLGNER